jgi:hypothetical protein
MAVKAYRLLRAILMTAALEDRLIPRNPCQIRGVDKEYSEERPVLTVAQVLALIEVMPYRKYRALILSTAFCSLTLSDAVLSARRRSHGRAGGIGAPGCGSTTWATPGTPWPPRVRACGT